MANKYMYVLIKVITFHFSMHYPNHNKLRQEIKSESSISYVSMSVLACMPMFVREGFHQFSDIQEPPVITNSELSLMYMFVFWVTFGISVTGLMTLLVDQESPLARLSTIQ